ncbi:ribonuclease P/MRP protein subunit Pop5p [Monosporozyma servazzii]
MVRLKSRYVLFEVILSPHISNVDEEEKEQETSQFTRYNILLSHHRPCPKEISIKTLIQEIRHSLQLNFGDYGSGKIGSLLQLKYFSNNTGTGIIRCHREDVDTLVASMMLINKIGDVENIIINPVKISATIKKIEQYSIRRSSKLLSLLNKSRKQTALKLDLVDNFNNVEEDSQD